MSFAPAHSAVTGRGAAAVYLILQHTAPTGTLLAPANLCYAALYPALYAGWKVRFCDVDPATGNLTPALFARAVERERPDAAILPHMYGQPIAGLPELLALCRQKHILTIEDCASAMGAQADYPVGRLGDYTVYSTGYAKTVEVGYGGLLASETDPLDWVEKAEQALPLRSEQTEQTEALFSRLYRVLRNEGDSVLDKAVYAALPQGAKSLFLYRLSPEEKARVRQAVQGLPEELARRRRILRDCEEALRATGLVGEKGPLQLYPYTQGAVPWRFSFFVPPALRGPLVAACLREGLPVSDWYPRVTPMFGDGGDYPGARQMEQTILNFPLQPQTARDICPALARLVRELEQQA